MKDLMRVSIERESLNLTRIKWKYAQLQAELTQLQAIASQLKAQGDCLTDARIDSSKPGGTARGTVAMQYRLRVKV